MTTDQDKQQAIEDYYRAMGWELRAIWNLEPPNIINHFPFFKKWVLEKMVSDGYHYYITPATYGEPIKFVWLNVSGKKVSEYDEVIIDNEITLAAVKAATRYWREKND